MKKYYISYVIFYYGQTHDYGNYVFKTSVLTEEICEKIKKRIARKLGINNWEDITLLNFQELVN